VLAGVASGPVLARARGGPVLSGGGRRGDNHGRRPSQLSTGRRV
jgi:hypothetical protein